MLFNSYVFILLFLPIALMGYFSLNYFRKYKLALAFIFGMSLWFYGYFNVSYLAIILCSILINFFVGSGMHAIRTKRMRFVLFVFGIALNLAGIFYFKYYDFFVENINGLFKTDWNLKHILLPLGISFFTFQQISYIVDCYKDASIHYDFLEYAVYVTFFPQLIAGPIVLHSELVPQLTNPGKKTIDFENLSKGLYTFSLGLGKKVLLADTFALFVNYGYLNITSLSSLEGFITALFYTLQIYFDFSGYCDMALGIGYLFNIELPHNFNSPYKAVTIKDFWDRWHMTLTRFFTQYVYIPLGGSRKGKIRTYANTMIVFLVSGLWHGANWTFILWGTLHGIGMVFERIGHGVIVKVPKAIMGTITFLLVNFLWIFFRANNISDAVSMFRVIFLGFSTHFSKEMLNITDNIVEMRVLARILPDALIPNMPVFLIMLLAVIGMAGVLFMKNTQEKVAVFRTTLGKYIVSVILMVMSILSFSGVSEFLYFNF